MNKAKDKLAEIRSKIFDRKQEQVVEEATKVVEASMDGIMYDVIQDPDQKGRSFIMIKVKYDLKTRTAAIVDVCPFEDKAAGLTIQLDKENRRYLFEKNNRKGKSK